MPLQATFVRNIPSILPCSQSTQIQSGLALARALEILVLGTMAVFVSELSQPGGVSACIYSSARCHSWVRYLLRRLFAVCLTFA